MTDEDVKIEEALRKCADVHLPDDFADRLAECVRRGGRQDAGCRAGAVLVRVVLVAASLAVLLGFVPKIGECRRGTRPEAVAQVDEIRPTNRGLPQDVQLNALALLGFCREVMRRRVKPLMPRFRKRREDE